MNTKTIKILITEPMAEEGVSLLKKHPNFEVQIGLNMPSEDLLTTIPAYDCLLVRSQTKVDADLLKAGINLKLVGRAGVGIDNIDINQAKARGIAVINTPSGNSISAAELAFGLMLSLARKIPFAHNHVRQGLWDRGSFKGIELFQKTLSIIGFGNVGQQLAKRALAFDMKVIAYDPVIRPSTVMPYIQDASLEEAFKAGDFISLHCPLNDSTKSIINQQNIALMKKGVMLINTARGELIDDEALLSGLNEGPIGFAALDVFSKEPPSPKDPLLHHPKIVLTPHLGASTSEAQQRVSYQLALDTVAFFSGQELRRIV